jgi:hypothetical protein
MSAQTCPGSAAAALGLCLSLSGVLVAQTMVLPADIDWLTPGLRYDSLSKAGLTQADREAVLAQVEMTSFDTPESWLSELRVGRVSLGASEGLVVRATQMLCGGTGNCETWVFRCEDGRWVNLFDGEAPVISGLGLVRQNAAIPDLVTTANLSAEVEYWTRYTFDGKGYRRSECYEVEGRATSRRVARRVCR